MANSISLELALHCNASNSPDACGSVKKNYQEDDDNYIIGTVIRPWLESRKLDAKVSPRCAAVVKFHARVYSHNCERSPTLSLHKWLVMGFKKDKCVIRACLCHCASMC